MALQPLRNERWGFESNCFVCEPKNETGLRIPFAHDDDADVVVGEFSLDEAFSGAPSYVHGGLTLAILDEAQAWATIAIAGKFAVTSETSARFHRPVRIGRPYRVEATVTASDDERIATSAVVSNQRGEPCAESTAVFTVLSPATARDAVGTEVTGADARFLRGADPPEPVS